MGLQWSAEECDIKWHILDLCEILDPWKFGKIGDAREGEISSD
jgi:hypothetical protein